MAQVRISEAVAANSTFYLAIIERSVVRSFNGHRVFFRRSIVENVLANTVTVMGQTVIKGNLQCQHIEECEDSKIFGTLTTRDRFLKLKNCRVRNITLEAPLFPSPVKLLESRDKAEVYTGEESWEEWFRDKICTLETGRNSIEFVFGEQGNIRGFDGTKTISKLTFPPADSACAISDRILVRSVGLSGNTTRGDRVTDIRVSFEQEGEAVHKRIRIAEPEVLHLFQEKAQGLEVTVRKVHQVVILDNSQVHTIQFRNPGGVVKLINQGFVARVINGYVLRPSPRDEFTENATFAALQQSQFFSGIAKETAVHISEYLDRVDAVSLALTSIEAAEQVGINPDIIAKAKARKAIASKDS